MPRRSGYTFWNGVIKLENKQFFFRYLDNGQGYPEIFFAQQTKGMGRILIQNMVRQLLGEPSFENVSEGASFSRVFRQKQILVV